MTTDQEVEDVNHKLSRLQVSGNVTKGDADVSSANSPTSLDDELCTWLDSAAESTASSVGPSPRVYTKILVSNAAAGSIIGKAGTNINNFQQQTFARMQLSKSEEYFPGTTERTLLISGTLKQVIAALKLVLNKLLKEGVAPISPRYKASLQDKPSSETSTEPAENAPITSKSARLMIKLLVPQALCGIVIGKSGSNVKQSAEKSNTSIRMIGSEGLRLPLTHNIFVISGQTEGILKAVALMMLKQCQDLKYQSFSELHSTYLTAPVGHHDPMTMMQHSGGHYYIPYATHPAMMQGGPGGHIIYDPSMAAAAAAAAPGGAAAPPEGVGGYYSLPVILTDQQTDLLSSRAGVAVIEVEQLTSTRIILHRDSRTLTISGVVEGVQMAHYMLSQRLAVMMMQQQAYVQQSQNTRGSGGRGMMHQHQRQTYYSNGGSSSEYGYGGQHRYSNNNNQQGSRGGDRHLENGSSSRVETS